MTASLYDLSLKYKHTFENFSGIADSLCLRHDLILGKAVSNFEQEISDLTSTPHVLGVGNGTDALQLILNYLCLTKSSSSRRQVITTPLSYLASTSSIHLSGLEPVFADIDDSLNLDPNSVQSLISSETLAVLFVHYSGNPTNIDLIREVCESRNLPLIEDCAQSFGATLSRQHVGSFGLAGGVSLHPLKLLSCLGDGGLVLTHDQNIYDYITKARNHGHTSRDDVQFWSMNSRLDSFQALAASSQIRWFNSEIITRRRQADIYKEILPFNFFPRISPTALPVYNWMVLLVPNRSSLIGHLSSLGIESKVHYPKLIPELSPYQSSANILSSLPEASIFKDMILSVPIGSHLSDSSIAMIASTINAFYE